MVKFVVNIWGKFILRLFIIGFLMKNVWEEIVGSIDINVVFVIMVNDEDVEYEKIFGMFVAR